MSSVQTALPHRRAVLERLRRARGEGLTLARLVLDLGGAADAERLRHHLLVVLAEAEAKGEALRSGRNRWIAVEYTDCFAGTLRLTSRGFGVVRLDEPDLPDIPIPPEKLGTALDGDLVLVHRGTKRKAGRLTPERLGEVVRVLRRRRPTLVGRFVEGLGQPWVEPFARRLNMKVHLEPLMGEPPRPGEFVEVELAEEAHEGEVRGRLLRRLGAAGESGVDEEVILAELAIPVEFPPDALREADVLPGALRHEDVEGREDLRDQPAVTIDGETAKDFDDAVAAKTHASGAIEVFVHIADVSSYVRAGGALDAAARERGTSVYLPGRCVPMLPEKLSNHLCSLLPGEDRLAFTVRFVVNEDGGVEGYRAFRSVFRSRYRCTYTQVNEWLEGGTWPPELAAGVQESLVSLDQAARRLGERRRQRGAIDFDLPEPEILLNPDGFMTGVVATPRNRAHRLIEELMIAANECVARMLTWGRQQGLFRIHERPQAGKLAELQAVLESFGVGLKGDLEQLPPRELQRVLDAIVGRPEERFLQSLILRSLARASYSAECRGHYALATDFYLHFTSPIRRYPDLVVHRFLGDLLAGRVRRGGERELVQGELEDLAEHCSFTERRAEEAEREVVKWKQTEYMKAHLGETFVGHITGVVVFGVFVQLEEAFIEGLVHVSDLKDDYYRYDEGGHRLVGTHLGRSLRLGDRIAVKVKGINEEFMEVQLEPVLAPVLAPRPEKAIRGDRERGRSTRRKPSRQRARRPRG